MAATCVYSIVFSLLLISSGPGPKGLYTDHFLSVARLVYGSI